MLLIYILILMYDGSNISVSNKKFAHQIRQSSLARPADTTYTYNHPRKIIFSSHLSEIHCNFTPIFFYNPESIIMLSRFYLYTCLSSISFLLLSCATHQSLTTHKLSPWQIQENKRFANPLTSPLDTADLATFEGLDFYPYNPAFKIDARLIRTPDAPIFEMTTTTKRRPKYRQYGVLRFNLNNQALRLNVYQSQDLSDNPAFRKLLFLPFYDATTGVSTYGGGRYITLSIPEGEMITIDFNEAYNPYCAYRDSFSCPITPLENNLQSIAIEAGTKDFKKLTKTP